MRANAVARRISSLKNALIKKSREAMMAAVQIYNNPQITFKSEMFIVNAIIAWTYLLHAYYRDNNIEYRYFKMTGSRRKFNKTKHGEYKYWELEKCLNSEDCPLDKPVIANLKYLIEIRHEIEHQMTLKIDEALSSKFQACCLNFNEAISNFFDKKHSLHKELSLALQFSGIDATQKETLRQFKALPNNIKALNTSFETDLDDSDYSSSKFSYSVYLVEKKGTKGSADSVVEFIKPGSTSHEEVHRVLVNDKEKRKYKPKVIVETIQGKGFDKFNIHQHTKLWQKEDARNLDKKYGVELEDGQWYWYEKWYQFVLKHVKENEAHYKTTQQELSMTG